MCNTLMPGPVASAFWSNGMVPRSSRRVGPGSSRLPCEDFEHRADMSQAGNLAWLKIFLDFGGHGWTIIQMRTKRQANSADMEIFSGLSDLIHGKIFGRKSFCFSNDLKSQG